MIISIFCHRCHILTTIAIKCVVFRIEFVRNFTAVGASDHSDLFASLSKEPMWVGTKAKYPTGNSHASNSWRLVRRCTFVKTLWVN
jgi:hypothetical protein